MPTLTTVPLLILIGVLWYLTKGRILSIIVFTSIFDAASALNFGGMGVSPWLLTMVICIAVKGVQGKLRLRMPKTLNRPALALMFLFVLYTLFSGMVWPFLFAGVQVSRVGVTPVPLAWSAGNLAQILYLLAAVVMYVLALTANQSELEDVLTWYVRACKFAALMALYQLAGAIVHVPYPDAILYTSPGHTIYHAYQMNGFWRLNSTFNEASEMAGFLTMALGMQGWKLVTEPLKVKDVLWFVLMLGMIVLTFSTTGYLCLAFMATVGLACLARRTMQQGGISMARLLVLVVAIPLAAGFLVVDKKFVSQAGDILTSVVLDKSKSLSYRERTETHVLAVQTLEDTYYMGAGWGSIRASGLVFQFLGTIGIPGTLLFFACWGLTFTPLFRPKSLAAIARNDSLYERSLLATAITMCGLVIAGSEPTLPILWVALAMSTRGREGLAQFRPVYQSDRREDGPELVGAGRFSGPAFADRPLGGR